MLGILYRIYEKKLENEVFKKTIPGHIAVIMDEMSSDDLIKGLNRFVEWSRTAGIKEITFAISCHGMCEIEEILRNAPGKIRLITDGKELVFDNGDSMKINFLLNFGGKREIVEATRELAMKVLRGELDPERIDEETIEKHLRIPSEPDVILRASLKLLDFLIWQSIYSEHIFFDIDWKNLRYIDFLRILREYQKRERRYGK